MSINQLESKLKSLHQDEERFSRDLENERKNELRYLKEIERVEKSVNKNTSASLLRSKLNTISSYKEKVLRSRSKQSDIEARLNRKRTEVRKTQVQLQNETGKSYDEILSKQNAVIIEQRNVIDDLQESKEHKKQNQVLTEKEFDFFISHASEDKEAIAEPLANKLIIKGAKVWYDKFTLTVGDSLRESIDSGLANSRYGIVILSEIYFKKFWTGKELNGLFAKQEDGQKVILPLWHNVSKDVVKQHSPILADLLALKTADFTVEELAEEFIKLIK